MRRLLRVVIVAGTTGVADRPVYTVSALLLLEEDTNSDPDRRRTLDIPFKLMSRSTWRVHGCSAAGASLMS